MRRSRVRWFCVGICLFWLLGCTRTSIHEIALALNERQVAHCLFLHAGVPGYGYGTLLAKSGDLDCVAIWRQWSQPPL